MRVRGGYVRERSSLEQGEEFELGAEKATRAAMKFWSPVNFGKEQSAFPAAIWVRCRGLPLVPAGGQPLAASSNGLLKSEQAPLWSVDGT